MKLPTRKLRMDQSHIAFSEILVDGAVHFDKQRRSWPLDCIQFWVGELGYLEGVVDERSLVPFAGPHEIEMSERQNECRWKFCGLDHLCQFFLHVFLAPIHASNTPSVACLSTAEIL